MSLSLFGRRRRLIAAGILVLALAVRLWDLTARPLWFDEAGEYWVSTAPFAHLVESVRTGTGDPPLYEFMLHAWMSVSHAEGWLRLLSVIASVSGVAAAMILAGLTSGPVAAMGAGILLALLPADIRYAQEAGQYGFVPAVVGWNLVCLILMMREKNWRWLLAWVLTALAASYLYYAAVIPVAAAFLCAIVECVWRRDMRARRATGTALVLYIAGVVPLLISYLPTQLARVVESGGTGSPDRPHGFLGIVRHKWEMASQLVAFQFTGWPHTHIPSWVIVVPALFGLFAATRKSRRLRIWFAAAVNAYAVAAVLKVFPWGYRWGLIVTPFIICASATALVTPGKRMRWAAIAAFALLVGVSVYSLPNRTLRDRVYADPTGAWPETEDMRMVAQFWLEHRTPDQPTYVYYGAAPAFAYYTRDAVPRAKLESTWCLACWHDKESAPFCREGNVYYGRWLRRLDANEKLASVVESLGGTPPSFWMVFGHLVPGDDRDMIAGFKREGYRVAAAVEGVNASACLLTRGQ